MLAHNLSPFARRTYSAGFFILGVRSQESGVRTIPGISTIVQANGPYGEFLVKAKLS